MVFSIFLNKKLIPVLAVLILFLVLAIGSPSFSLFQNLVKTTDQSSFDELELRLPDVALAQSIGISICELDYQNINQIEITDYKKAIKGLSFLQKELNKNYKEDSLQSLITKILKNEYPLNENDSLCLPPLLISANAGEEIKGKELPLASQKISCKGEAYLDNKYGITDSLVNYSAYLKNNKVVNKLNKNLKNLELKQKSLTAPKQINNTNKNILRTTLARNTAKFYLKHSDKLITFYESLCLQAPAHEEQENENPPATPTPSNNTCEGGDSQSCSITNGTGIETRTCNNGTWSNYGTCSLESCNFGYQISRNSCEEITNPTPSPTPPSDRISPPSITSPTTSEITVNSSGEVTVSWTAVNGAIGYLTRYQNITDSTAAVMNTNHNTTSLTFTPVIGKEYKFWVHAKDTNFSYANPDSYSEQDTVFFTARAVVTPSPTPNNCTGLPTQACNITNGTGQQTRTCNGGTWSNFVTCNVVTCNSGFQISGNSCLATVTSPFRKGDQVELTRNTNFRKTAALTGVLIQQLPTGRVGTIVGDSAIRNTSDSVAWREVDFGLGQVSYAGEDNFKIHQDIGTCTGSPTQSCTIANGVGLQTRTCTNDVWGAFGSCAIQSCNSGYGVSGSSCVLEVNSCSSGAASSITQYGITWYFDQAYPCGKFVNGDYWVNPKAGINNNTVKITRISPDYANGRNGWEVNPNTFDGPLNGLENGYFVKTGYDSRVNTTVGFDETLIPQLPYYAKPDESIVKAVSSPNTPDAINYPGKPYQKACWKGYRRAYLGYTGVPGQNDDCRNWGYLKDVAVLTVLASPASSNSFRPAYNGTFKKLHTFDTSMLNKLLRLAPSSNLPSLDSLERDFQRLQLDDGGIGWKHDQISPTFNVSYGYGATLASQYAAAVLRLQLDDITQNSKEKLLKYLIQTGIDYYGAYKNGKIWHADGGHFPRAKLPVIFAGFILGDQDMLKIVSKNKNLRIFSEDFDWFYTAENPPLPTNQYKCYLPLDIKYKTARGFARYNGKGSSNLSGEFKRCNNGAENTYYTVNLGGQKGNAIVVELLGLQEYWANSAFLDVVHRANEQGIPVVHAHNFTLSMYVKYHQSNYLNN